MLAINPAAFWQRAWGNEKEQDLFKAATRVSRYRTTRTNGCFSGVAGRKTMGELEKRRGSKLRSFTLSLGLGCWLASSSGCSTPSGLKVAGDPILGERRGPTPAGEAFPGGFWRHGPTRLARTLTTDPSLRLRIRFLRRSTPSQAQCLLLERGRCLNFQKVSRPTIT